MYEYIAALHSVQLAAHIYMQACVVCPQSGIAGGVDPGHPTVPFPGVEHRPVYQVDELLHPRGK